MHQYIQYNVRLIEVGRFRIVKGINVEACRVEVVDIIVAWHIIQEIQNYDQKGLYAFEHQMSFHMKYDAYKNIMVSWNAMEGRVSSKAFFFDNFRSIKGKTTRTRYYDHQSVMHY